MTGPHLIIIAICLTSALTGLWLLRQGSCHRPPVAMLGMATAVETLEASPEVACKPITRPVERVTDPVLVVRQVCLATEDVARHREIDLLRPFNVSVPPLEVARGPLVALLKSVLENALEATPRRGAVICAIKMTAHHVHFVVSDSSGCAEDGAALLSDPLLRKESLQPDSLVAEALGGRMIYTDHPGEGVVVDLAFRRLDMNAPQEPQSFSVWSENAENDHSTTARGTVSVPVTSGFEAVSL